MKHKYKIISKVDANKWCDTSNLFAKSLFPCVKAINQFNSLSADQRSKIKRKFDYYDNIRRRKIPKGEGDTTWLTCVMVDANIIATEFNIDTLTVIMCLNPPCKIGQKVIIR